MKKNITSFVCQECGYESPQWLGKCPECGAWNSLKEFHIASSKKQLATSRNSERVSPQKLHEIIYSEKTRLLTGFSELDTVLGGGFVLGSVTLLAGDPGIGKSTLLLQVGLNISKGSQKVLYISGEESVEQIKLRAERILGNSKRVQNNTFLLLSSNNVDSIISAIEDQKPALVIIDSIQTMESEAVGGLAGSVPQIRYCSQVLIRVAKQMGIPIVLVGHVTKEGMVAGPMLLSHMVDTVLFFEGDKTTNTRILRGFKNRFGPVDEVGVFAMEGVGMTQIENPEDMFLTTGNSSASGSVVTATIEGSRVFLVEVQGLAVSSKLPLPRRVVSGLEAKRVELLLAVLQKHCGMPTSAMDIFVNIAGGLSVSDRAVDLAVCLSLYSSYKNIPFGKTCAIAEVGLLGELRTVSQLDKRIKEAKKRGYKDVLTAKEHVRLAEVIKAIQ
ncbi:MAG: DNA repair protein RadA [Patescibacteria group bacterium]